MHVAYFCVFVFRPNVPVNNFSHVGTELPLPGYYQYFSGSKVSCSRTQHGGGRPLARVSDALPLRHHAPHMLHTAEVNPKISNLNM